MHTIKIEKYVNVNVSPEDILYELNEEELLDLVSERISEQSIAEYCCKNLTDMEIFGWLLERISGRRGIMTPDEAKSIISDWIDNNVFKSTADMYMSERKGV